MQAKNRDRLKDELAAEWFALALLGINPQDQYRDVDVGHAALTLIAGKFDGSLQTKCQIDDAVFGKPRLAGTPFGPA